MTMDFTLLYKGNPTAFSEITIIPHSPTDIFTFMKIIKF